MALSKQACKRASEQASKQAKQSKASERASVAAGGRTSCRAAGPSDQSDQVAVQRQTGARRDSLLAGAEAAEVLGSARHPVCEELQHQPSALNPPDAQVEPHAWKARTDTLRDAGHLRGGGQGARPEGSGWVWVWVRVWVWVGGIPCLGVWVWALGFEGLVFWVSWIWGAWVVGESVGVGERAWAWVRV